MVKVVLFGKCAHHHPLKTAKRLATIERKPTFKGEKGHTSRLVCFATLLICSVATRSVAMDWLLNPLPFKASVTFCQTNGELVLENGLVRRVLRLAPNAATIDLQNLTTGEHLLRAVGPEARVTINGAPFAVGGLEGQPINNYISAECLDDLDVNPNAYRFEGWTEGPIEAHMAWKKHPEWLSRDLPWPPPGRQVVLRFVPPPAGLKSDGPTILKEIFDGPLKPEWKVLAHADPDHTSFGSEGKSGEIVAGAATAFCTEHAWPAGAATVEVMIDSGNDFSDVWGPGLALVIDGQATPFITNPGSGTFSVGSETTGTFDRSKPCVLRVRIVNGEAICEATQDEMTWQRIGMMPSPKPPTALRVGKVGLDGSGQDSGTDRSLVHCRLMSVIWRGASATITESSAPRPDLPDIEVHYDIYDGLPLLSKWLTITNNTSKTVRVNRFVSEELHYVEPEISVGAPPTHEYPNLLVETDYAFGANESPYYDNPAVKISADPDYQTQVNYANQTPCLLRCEPPEMGPDADVASGSRFESFRAYDLLLDSTERERRTMAQRRMYRTIAPWTAENPLMFHEVNSDPKRIRDAIDQAHEVGFEMIIVSFGSGLNLESTDHKYLETYKELADDARAKGVALGGYSLLASRSAANPKDNTQGRPAMFGIMPCLGSEWGQWYLGQLRYFLGNADFGVLENDGSYPGDRCSATNHPGHHGLEDSQWVQWRDITDFYKWCRSKGIFLNIPDWYFLSGGNKCAMGYKETDWSLPRADQELIERQNIYDGTWNKTASMGWMFVPLTQYHGGGEAATIEPLRDHLSHYEQRLANLLGAGVQACWRGPRLYDTEETKNVVKHWVLFYKAHRQVLDGDIIHLRRANGLDWDGWLHVNPQGKEKGLLMVFNPLNSEIRRTLSIPLYYTGLTSTTMVHEQDGKQSTFKLDRDYHIDLPATIPAHGLNWFVLE
jgi:hypothetical protein